LTTALNAKCQQVFILALCLVLLLLTIFPSAADKDLLGQVAQVFHGQDGLPVKQQSTEGKSQQ